MTIKIREFKEKFDKEYNFLCKHRDNVAGYKEAVEWGDKFLRKYPDFVAKFAQYRGDFLTSDREMAAFAFTMHDYGYV